MSYSYLVSYLYLDSGLFLFSKLVQSLEALFLNWLCFFAPEC